MSKNTKQALHLCSDCHRNSFCLHQPSLEESEIILKEDDKKLAYYIWFDKQVENGKIKQYEAKNHKDALEEFISHHKNCEWYYGE